VETRAQDPDALGGRKGLRIAGGVVLIIFGLWGLLGGGCSVAAGAATRSFYGEAIEAQGAQETKDGGEATRMMRQTRREMSRMWFGLMVSGVVVALAGLLANVAAVFFFLGRGWILGLIAALVGVVGEALFLGLVTFNLLSVVKIAAFGFVGACALVAVRPRRAPQAN